MADVLKVDLTALAEASHELNAVAAELTDTDDRVHEVQAAVGAANETHHLRNAIGDFSSKWKVRRGEVKDDVAYLAEMASKVANELAATDSDLAQSVSSGSSAPAPTGLTPSSGYQRAV